MPLINAIQKTLLHDLFTSFLSACILITAVMMVVERGVVTGALAMIPNVFSMILLFGLLGWTGASLDIGSVMTASIALGMAVDGELSPQEAAPGDVHQPETHSGSAMTGLSLACVHRDLSERCPRPVTGNVPITRAVQFA